MIRQKVLEQWKSHKEKVLALKKKSIYNYAITERRAILGVDNERSASPLTLCDIMVKQGRAESHRKYWKSNHVVEIHTQLLKVAILEEIDEEDPFLKNYEGEFDYGDNSE